MSRCVTAIALLCLAACATAPGGPSPGLVRRIATVVQVGDAASFGPLQDNDCRSTAAPARITTRYASVRYFSGRHAHLRIVPLADAFDLTAGDDVFVKPGACDDALSR